MKFLYSLSCIVFFNTLSAQQYNPQECVVKAIQQQEFKKLKLLLEKDKFSPQDKRLFITAAALQADQSNALGHFSTDSKKAIFSTGCVALIGAGCFSLEIPLKFVDNDFSFNRNAMPHIALGVALIAAGIASGYECETGYYTDRSRYIRDYLVEKFKKDTGSLVHVQWYSINTPAEGHYVWKTS